MRNLLTALIAALLLTAGGVTAVAAQDDGTPEAAAETTAGDTTETGGGGDEATKADIKLGVETTIGALKTKKWDVFCGGLSLRYENASFGGPGTCQKRAKAGKVPEAFKTASTVSTIEVSGTKATATLDNGAKVFLVKGTSFWEIDGVG